MSQDLLPTNQLKAIQEYNFISKYARYNPKLNRRETWSEAVDRVRDMHLQRYGTKGIDDEIKWAFDQVKDKRVLPSMRSMQFGGEAIINNDARMYNCSYSLADRPRFFSEMFWLLLSGVGVGFSVQKQHVDKLPKLIEYCSPDEKEIFTYTVADTIEGWADALDVLMSTFFVGTPISGKEVFFDFSKIRRRGSLLKTSGGRAPGAKPLRVALKRIKQILREAVELRHKKLKPVQVYDISMMAADAVIAGGVRRSATISLFSYDDEEMMNAKTFNQVGQVLSNKRKDGSWLTDFGVAWNLKKDDKTEPTKGESVNIAWLNIKPWRARSNNSAILLKGKTTKEQFQSIVDRAKKYGEPGFAFVTNLDHGYNPCFAGSNLLLTADGYKTIKDLWIEGGKQEYHPAKSMNDYGTINVVNSQGVVQSTNVYRTSTNNEIYEVTFDNGASIRATDNHQFFVLENGKKVKRQLRELKLDDRIPINTTSTFGSVNNVEYARLAGWVIGDGSISCKGTQQQSHVRVFDQDVGCVDPILRSDLIAVYSRYNQSNNQNPRYDGRTSIVHGFQHEQTEMNSLVLGRLLHQDGVVVPHKKKVPQSIWNSDKETVSAFLCGVFSADGHVEASYEKKTISIRLSQANYGFLQEVQKLLNQFGMTSKIHCANKAGKHLMNDGKGGKKLYNRRDSWRLVISGRVNCQMFMNDIGFIQARQNLKAFKWLSQHPGSYNSAINYVTKVKSVKLVGTEETYCLTEPVNNEVVVNGICVSQCLEISLNPIDSLTGETGFAFCNLTEINGGSIKSKEDFASAVKAATVIGTLQAGYTYLHYLTDATRRIARRERLLGVSVTGWTENPSVLLDPKTQREMATYAVQVNKEFAERIGIEQAARVTCTKPAGNSSLILGTSSGIHPHHAKRYFRRIQANSIEVPLQFFKIHNPAAVEKSVWGEDDEIITFCYEAPEGALLKDDLSAIQLLDLVKSTWENWVLPGTARPESSPGAVHNVSNTVEVAEDEWDLIAEYIFKNQECFSGISLLPKVGDKVYQQAPMERIVTSEDQKKWNYLISSFYSVDWSTLDEGEDQTMLMSESACAGGMCSR